MKRILAGFALVLVLAGCSAETAPEPSEATTEATVTTEAAATSVAAAPSNDLTDTVQKLVGQPDADVITSAIEEEPGRFIVETTLVDPRGADGSVEAKRALAICELLASKDDVRYVNVMEADGTSWILFGHPMVTEGECGEV